MPAIPPLRQSARETMACPHSYGLVYIEGLKPPNTKASSRGSDIHAVLASYVTHCASKRVPADYAYMDSLTSSSTEEVAGILESCRENIVVDWNNLFGSEISMGLDIDFQPTYSVNHDDKPVGVSPIWGFDGSRREPAYCGILDTIYLMPGGTVASIRDFKSHPRPFPADSFQGKLYSLMLFMHIPELKEVEFALHFVRYANKITTQKYYRSDVPAMMEDVRRERGRQYDYHETYVREGLNGLPAFASGACTYCPCVLDPIHIPCPIAKLNPMTNLSPAERLNWRLVHDVMNRTNNEAMKNYVDGSEQDIHSQDANGKNYTFGPVAKEKITFPLFTENGTGGFDMPIIDALLDWQNAYPEDLQPKKRDQKPWFCNLRIGSTQLKSYLKAKKRELIDNRVKDLAIVETKEELRITRDAEIDDGNGEEHHEWDGEDFQF
jgi:hypothetical protein